MAILSISPPAVSADQKDSSVPEILEFEYTVKKGDTLWSIAKRDFIQGKGIRWQKVYDLNRKEILNPNLIKPGMKLKVKLQLHGPTGTSVEQRSKKMEDGSIVRNTLSTVASLGPGPRRAVMEMS